MGRPAAFLDRDGVLNAVTVVDGVPRPPRTASELRILPGAATACSRLRAAGLVIVVVTNQPEIARGTIAGRDVADINATLGETLDIDVVCVCPHDDADGCSCRKPAPGLLFDAADRFGIDLRRSTMVGDRWRDVEAGIAACVATVFVDCGYAERRPTGFDHRASSLLDAVPFVLERARQGARVP